MMVCFGQELALSLARTVLIVLAGPHSGLRIIIKPSVPPQLVVMKFHMKLIRTALLQSALGCLCHVVIRMIREIL